MMPKRSINLSYGGAVATPSPSPVPINNTFVTSQSNVDMIDMSLHIPTSTDVNISCLAELETSLVSIQSDRDSMQSDHKQSRNNFKKVISGLIKHSKEIQEMHSDVRGLTEMIK
jgi:hypothetical protein